MDYLFHYTSVDVLELILKNRTIRFNPLYKMDDQQEQYSAHGSAQGSHYFISSWTAEEAEIPNMWRDYCKPKPENGVRLRLPVNPFSKKENNLNTPVPAEMIVARRNREKIILAILDNYPETTRDMFEGFEGMLCFGKYKEKLKKDFPMISQKLIEASEQLMREMTIAECRDVDKLLCQVHYTDDPRKIYPQLYHSYQGQLFGTFSDYGRFKNTYWKWQKEWRYILAFYKMTAFRKHANGKLEWYPLSFDHYDLKLDPDKLKELQITTSPVISDESKKKLDSILNSYLPGTTVKESCLKSL